MPHQDPALSSRREQPLIGRKEELEKVQEALNTEKIPVIVAAPGEGKSKIAAEAAAFFPGQPQRATIDLSSTYRIFAVAS